MKKLKRLGAVILLMSLLSASVSAAEISVYELSNYRCLNSTCGAYLEKQHTLGTCPEDNCEKLYYAYKCPVCGSWFAICDNGHYCPTYGRSCR